MMSLATQIRQAIIAQLRQCKTLEGRIFDTPSHAFTPDQLPLLIVTVEKDQILPDWTSILTMALTGNCLAHMRELSLTLKAIVKGSVGAVERLENISRDVVATLLANSRLDGLCKDMRCQEISEITISDKGEQPISSMSIHCVVWYRILEQIPDKPYA